MSHFVVFGNEKGGTGKSTLAMHVLVCLLEQGRSVGVIDLDARQRSVSRFLENRARFAARSGVGLAMPETAAVDQSGAGASAEQDQARLQAALDTLRGRVEFVVIDCPGSHTYPSQLAHALADTLVTPLNDSFVDLDVLIQVEPQNHRDGRLSHYAEMVFDSRKFRSASQMRPMDWVVTANRIGTLHSRNNARVAETLGALKSRLMFRPVPGLSERVIYRELFPQGLTMMDLGAVPGMGLTSISHVAARHEVRELVRALNLPPARAAEPLAHDLAS